MRSHCAITPSRTAAIAGIALLCAAAHPAPADVVEANWTSSSDFQYWIYHMPDFDQKRDTLPGGGSAYCVPTSTMNVMAYVGNHGFPEVLPGSGNWQDPANYVLMSNLLGVMGSVPLMNTDPSTGTTGGQQLNGANAWLPDEKFVVNQTYTGGFWAPKIQDFGGSAITGGLVTFCYGRYDIVGYVNGFPVISRDGGHCVTLSRIDVNGPDWLLWIRNPSTSDPDTVQSLFANTEVFPAPRLAISPSLAWTGVPRLYTELLVEGSAKLRLIDSYFTLRTKQGYSFDDTGVTAGIHSPFGNLAGAQPPVPFDLPGGQNVLEVIPLPDGLGYASLIEDTNADIELVQLSLRTVDPIPVPGPSVEVDGGCSMVLGDNRKLYVLCGTVLEMLDPDDRLRKLKRVNLPFPCSKVLYDDLTDQVCLVPSIGGPSLLLIFPAALDGDPVMQPVPTGSLIDAPCVGACAPDGTIYLANAATGEIHCIPPTRDSFQSFSIGGIACVESIDVDDRGHLFVVCDGDLTEVVPDGIGGWMPDRDSAWDGMPVGKFFHVDRSRTNWDPTNDDMRGLDNNVAPDDPEEDAMWGNVEDCLADANSDLIVGIADFLGLLGAWGTADPLYDFAPNGGDGTVGIDDFLKLLTDWGLCYP